MSFYRRLKSYCSSTGASVTSFGRTPKHNREVGGLDESYHLSWLAADVVYDVPGPTYAQRLVMARHVGLELVHGDEHDHLEPPP